MAEVVPYGDTAGDGMVQLSFTLPVPADARAREIGLEFLRRNGLREPQIVHIAADPLEDAGAPARLLVKNDTQFRPFFAIGRSERCVRLCLCQWCPVREGLSA